MEDKTIVQGHYAYQLRVDISLDEAVTRFMEWREKYKITHYVVGLETAESGKEHIQALVWFEEKLENVTKVRNWWQGKCSNTRQPISCTSAKKIVTLASYCMKDKNYLTNLEQEQIELLPTWVDREEFRKNKKDKWTETIDGYMQEAKENELERQEVAIGLLEIYKKSNKMPTRTRLQYLMWRHGFIENESYAYSFLNLFG